MQSDKNFRGSANFVQCCDLIFLTVSAFVFIFNFVFLLFELRRESVRNFREPVYLRLSDVKLTNDLNCQFELGDRSN